MFSKLRHPIWAVLVAVLAFALSSSTAAAAPSHPFVETFGSVNEPTFAQPQDIVVDQSNGDVLVVSGANKTLSRWHADGTPDNFSALGTNVIDGQGGADTTPFGEIVGAGDFKEVQVAVDDSGGATQGNIYVTDSPHGVVDIFGSDGSYKGELSEAGGSHFGESCGVAVDPQGNVYVAEFSGQVHVFAPSGAVPANADNTLNFAAPEPCQLAAGAGPTAGSLFVATWGGAVRKYDASTGAEEYVVFSGSSGVIAVDPATGHLYVSAGELVHEYDASSTAGAGLVSTISTSSPSSVFGVAVDASSGDVYIARGGQQSLEVFGGLVSGEAPVVTTEPATGIENTEATLHGTVDPNEEATEWEFEYGLTTSYGSVVPLTPGSAGEGGDPVPVSANVSGLQPGTEYHYRLRATNSSGSTVGADTLFTTSAPAIVETTGSPVRSATTAHLQGRIDPKGAATSYHFEYGNEGPCDSNPCQSTPTESAGAGAEYVFVSQVVTGLEPGTTYHYRLVGDNGNIAGQTPGGDMTVTTRASDASPAPAPHPGPPGSDRGWEQVNVADTDGNPVLNAAAISDDGGRVLYTVAGSVQGSAVGNVTNRGLAERTSSGWRDPGLLPTRQQLAGPLTLPPAAAGDLSIIDLVYGSALSDYQAFRVNWGSGSDLVYQLSHTAFANFYAASADGATSVMAIRGSVDPAHPVGNENPQLYDLSSGAPRMVSLLPDGGVPACGIASAEPSHNHLAEGTPARYQNWVSADGSRVVFPSEGNVCDGSYQLYLHDLSAGTTALVSGPTLSGKSCVPKFIKQTEDAVFFLTESRLAAADQPALICDNSNSEGPGGDVYRYDIGDGALRCLTCVGSQPADVVSGPHAGEDIAVAPDGSRVYFASPHRLLPGAASRGIYRVDVASGNLRYVAPATSATEAVNVGENAGGGEALSRDGSVIVFRSNSPDLNAVGGLGNGGTEQYYRYDDRDRSLVCVSCPQDGSVPRGNVPSSMLVSPEESGPNVTPLDAAGDFAFVSPTPLVAADHNTAGPGEAPFVGNDIYEWRDGRLFLVTDGDARWIRADGVNAPGVAGFTSSGRDLFFTVPEKLTPDALDGFTRLYDARIGGGFDFPPEGLPPCDVNTGQCEGAPSAAPSQPGAGSAVFHGRSDPKPTWPRPCPKGKRAVRRHGKKHCVKRHHHHHERRPGKRGPRRTR